MAALRKISLTRSGSPMNSLRAERNAAMAPETWAAAIDVPLSST
ncbi:Uncharacterised protein [Mycobacteroides abscessus subsp. abscessus]|nr:Uncharacterised protein [Mycobacteroides abscessus subsp. abscessus]